MSILLAKNVHLQLNQLTLCSFINRKNPIGLRVFTDQVWSICLCSACSLETNYKTSILLISLPYILELNYDVAFTANSG